MICTPSAGQSADVDDVAQSSESYSARPGNGGALGEPD